MLKKLLILLFLFSFPNALLAKNVSEFYENEDYDAAYRSGYAEALSGDPESSFILGKILIDGFDISKVELSSLRNQIGIVPQEPLLFNGTIRDNIDFRDEATETEIIKASKLACAHDFIMDLPDGYSTLISEKGSTLSGGQRQRITIARALLNYPRILILDEATSALDYPTERRVYENLLNDEKRGSIFFVTHRLSIIKDADKIVVFHKGRIDEFGNHQELIEKKGRYYALLKQSKEK